MSGERLISARGPRPMGGERPLRAAAAAMESVALVAPVTALEFVGDLLLAGERGRAGPAGGRGAGTRETCCRWGAGRGGRGGERGAPVAVALGAPQRARAVRLAGPGRVLVLGETGGLVAYEVVSGRWEPLLPAEAVGPGAVLATTPLPGADPDGDALCAVGSAAGRLAVLALGQPAHVAHARLFEGTMHGLSWAARPVGTPGDTAVLLASGPGGELLWLDVGQRPGRAPWLRLAGRLALPPCKQRWLTCAALLPRDGLLCGDRRGSLLLFHCCSAPGMESPGPAACPDGTDCASETEMSFLEQKETLPLEEPLSVLFGLHGKTGVTSVTCHGGYVYSTGRDGCYRQLRVRAGQLEVLRKRRPCKGLQWVEELRFATGGDLLVLGFHSDSFVVWSSRAGEALHRVPCGGGHRSWSYSGECAAEAFAYVKQGDVMLYRGARQPGEQHVLLPSLHGRHITCVRRLGAVHPPGRPAVDVFVTGSEDTTARVLALDERSRSALPVTTLDDHISSVRALALAGPAQPRADGFSTLLFSAGGRAQIECYRLLLSGDPDAESTVACEVTHVASHRLDEYWDRMKNRHKLIKMDPETRYMSLSVVPVPDTEQLPPPCLFLAAACSDASVRVFGLLEATRQLVLVAESFHHQRCVLKVEAFLHGDDGGTRSCYLCSAATDGILAFWDITAALAEATAGCPRAAARPAPPPVALGAPLLTVPAHSCGVNSLHVRPAPGGRVLVASGSDDGSIHVCLLEAARRLTLWRLGPRGLQPLSSAFFHVPDLAELDCWEAEARGELHYCGVLCGQGLEVLRCPAAAAAVPRPHTLLCATVPAGDCCGEPSSGSAGSPEGTSACGAPQAEGEEAPEALSCSSFSVVAGPSCSPCAAPAVQRPGPHAPFS
uniref:tRNA (34-2'-O)-methyltransferase regulator WDR6 n=1 Tax=Nothoprocta perdicaria TaxID=30464 RepID=A0A8C7EA48_NOTPE